MAYAAAALLTYGALKQGQAARDAAIHNASVLAGEQSTATAQGAQAEDQVRRNSRLQLGKEIAAFGSAGVGYGGSSEEALRASSVNQEMDALNTRYKAQLAGYGYGVQAGFDRAEGQTQQNNSELMAGAKLLSNDAITSYLKQGAYSASGISQNPLS